MMKFEGLKFLSKTILEGNLFREGKTYLRKSQNISINSFLYDYYFWIYSSVYNTTKYS